MSNIYAKQVKNGSAVNKLSEEEKQALEKALNVPKRYDVSEKKEKLHQILLTLTPKNAIIDTVLGVNCQIWRGGRVGLWHQS